MAEYIEREALIAEYDRVHIGEAGGARKLMVEAPACDVVEVVRCKDCAFSREMYASEKKIFMQDCVGCTHLSMAGHAVIMSSDGFCSYGKRRSNDG